MIADYTIIVLHYDGNGGCPLWGHSFSVIYFLFPKRLNAATR